MKKILNILLVFTILFSCFIPPYEYQEVKADTYPQYAIVNFRTKSCDVNTYYTTDTGLSGYTNGCYGADAAFLGIENGKVKFKLSGVVGYVNPSEVEIRNMDPEIPTTYISNYIVEDGRIKHVIQQNVNYYNSANVISIGRAPGGLANGIYYSYDGIYFYEGTLNGFKKMIDDYKEGAHYRALNATKPYYNYYLYLPVRTISNYTVEDIAYDLSTYNSKMTSYPPASNESHLYGEELSFIEYQGEYGVNAIMSLSLAKNESNMGRSKIAYNKNNLFGMAAYDSSTGSAFSFKTVREGIKYFNKTMISEGYLDPKDKGNRYHGGHVGNKGSGFNVKYASDPYWGEKEASYYYNFDRIYGNQDYNKEKIGIKTNDQIYPIRKEPDNNATILYQTTNERNIPFVILEEVMVGNQKWYKVQTDPTLTEDRSQVLQDNGAYNFNQNYGYIRADYIGYVSNGNGQKAKYTIEFNPNGGHFPDRSETSSKKITVEEYTVPQVQSPVRDGYTFVGWNETVIPAQENKTYVAVWKSPTPQKYNIIFDANGGKFNDGTTTKSQSVEEGNKPTVPESPTRDGYVFKGWDSEISLVTGNKTYTAVWEKVPKKYEITFDADGGKFSDGSTSKVVTAIEGEKPQTIENPIREGYIFKGWSPEIVSATKNMTYTAIWEKEKEIYTVTFDANGGSFEDGSKKQEQKVEEGTKPTEPKAPTKKGYRFIGWDQTVTEAVENVTYKAVWEAVKTYEITFDANGGKFENQKDTLTVNVEENQKPTVNIPTKKGYVFQGWDPEITTATKNTTYKAIWKELSLDDLEEKNGLFYVDSFQKQDGKLKFKGYNTIEGIDNNLDTNIEYTLIFKNVETQEEVLSQNATRITNKENHPFEIYSVDGKDYTYAWFEMEIDFSKLPEGNYIMYMVSNTDQYYSKKTVNNLTNSVQSANYSQGDKNIIIRNNYNYENSPIELIVRNKSNMNVQKNVGTYYNQFDTYTIFEFTPDNLLHIRGLSYSYGMNLSNQGVTNRSLLFENVETYQVYSKTLGYITNGDYMAPLPENDSLGKERAWYDKSINLSDIPKGTYILYTTTTSQGKTDISEMTEKMGRSLEDVVKVIDGKRYSFHINYERGSRIEMVVE